MEEGNKIEEKDNIPVGAKEGASSASCEASALCETGINQSKEAESSSSTSKTETFDSSKHASICSESSHTVIKMKESDDIINRVKTDADTNGSGKAEIHQKSLIVMATSIEDGDKVGTTGTESGEERNSDKAASLESSGDKPIEIDSNKTRDKIVKGEQSLKETFECGNSTNLDKEEEDKTKDGIEQQDTEALKDSYNEKSKNDDIDDVNHESAGELDTNDDGLGTKPKKQRKSASEVTDDQNTSPVSQEICTDVDAEWSLDEKRRLLDALESDAGRRRWNAISYHVKTKNIQQIKYFTEKLRAEANGQAPAHLGGEKDDPLQAWISVCERLRGGQEDIDAKCIPQVMTIAAVEPTSSTQGNINSPNYARIYTFLSSILKGQTTAGLTPIDARVVLELIQSLEMKLMNAELHEQQSFLRSKYTNVAKDLEKEQIILAMDELQKKMIIEEEKDEVIMLNNVYEEGGSGMIDSQLLCESTKTTVDRQNNERSESPSISASCSTSSVGNSNLEIRAEKTDTPMDTESDKRSQTFESLPPITAAVADSDQAKMSNSDDIEKANMPMDIQIDKSSNPPESLPSCTAKVVDSEQANKDKQTPFVIQTVEKVDTSGTLLSITVMSPNSKKNGETKVDETNSTNPQSSPSSSKTGEMGEISSSMPCSQNTVTPRPKRKRATKISTPSPSESTRSKEESRNLKIKKWKRSLKKPKLSSLNPVCVPVTMLNVKPRSYNS